MLDLHLERLDLILEALDAANELAYHLVSRWSWLGMQLLRRSIKNGRHRTASGLRREVALHLALMKVEFIHLNLLLIFMKYQSLTHMIQVIQTFLSGATLPNG